MTSEALRSPVVSKLRDEVPEFETEFQRALADEDGEIGSFQAMSLFGAWLVERLRTAPDAPEVERSFAAVEKVASTPEYPMGRALVTEFVEVISGSSDAISHLGPATRAYLQST